MNSIKLQNRMNTTFTNPENSKTSDLQRLLLNTSDKINIKVSNKYVSLSYLSVYCTWKNIEKPYIRSKFKVPGPTI